MRRLSIFLLIYCCLTPSHLLADSLSSQLPNIGSAGSSILSPRAEQLLGKEFMRSVRNSLNLLDDRPTTAYLQVLADRLASSLQEEHAPITIFLVNAPSINAFAGPGGYIGVHTGLLLSAHTEDELASVIAHEIAHVTQRHLVRSFEASQRMSLPTMGAILAAIVLGTSNPEAGKAVLATTLATSAQQQLTHSRSSEQEADNIGIDMLANANFDPQAMVVFFETLQNKQGVSEHAAPEFLRTHPLTLGRIADARNRAAQLRSPIPGDNTIFQLMQARTAVLTKRPIPATPKASKPTQQYFQALQAAQKENFSKARTLLSGLIKKNNHSMLFQYSAAQVELADNQPQRAHDILKQTLVISPGNLLLIELYVESLLELQQFESALQLLKTTLRKHPEQFRLYHPYARAAKALSLHSETYRALAEYAYAQGGIYQAVDYLEQALKTPGLDTYDRLSLQARQDMLKSEVKQRELPISQDSE